MNALPVIEERPFVVEADGAVVARGTCSPDALGALAVGRLLTDGLLAERTVTAVEVADAADGLTLRVTLQPHRSAAGRPPMTAPPIPLDSLPALFRDLFRVGDERHPQGGVHVVALTNGAALLHAETDVGRHNAVDKVLGAALLDGTDVSRLGLVLSARVSGEIARKAAIAGVAWIASRSVPTSLAVVRAGVAGLTIIGRAASRDPLVWHPVTGA